MRKARFIKLISLVLSLIMTILCFASCGGKNDPANSSDTEATDITTDTESTTTDAESEDTTETEPDTPDEPEDVTILPIFSNKETKYTIVTPESLNRDILTATNELKCLLASFANVSINIWTVEKLMFLNEGKLNKPKIIIGSIAEDSDSVNMRYELGTGEFMIKFTKNTLYITGKSNADTLRAWEYFKLTYLYKGMTELAFEDGFCYESKSEQVSDIKIDGTDISEFKIVHYNNFHSKKYAEYIRSAIYRKTGITLPLTTDASKESAHEILVGKTNRDESESIRATYDRPNVYYDIKTLNGKLVIMGEGYKTLEHVTAEFEKYLNAITSPTDISGSVIDGDVKDFVDTTTMIDRAEGTDLRVLHYNMAAPLIYSDEDVYGNDTERGEAIADMILAYYPDIITTDEVYNNKKAQHHINLYKAVMGELYEYYYLLDDSPYETNKPVEGVTGDEFGINENILHKKSLGLEVVTSGWRYGSVKNDSGTYYLYLGFHTAVFKDADGKKFIVSAGHYGESGTNSTWAAEHQDAIADAQAASGSSETLPTIITGDMFTTKGRVGYNYHVSKGFFDAQQSAAVNCNVSVRGDVMRNHTTFHTVGMRQTDRAAEDFVWYNASFSALQFKVIASELTDKTSDHYPVCADLKFN